MWGMIQTSIYRFKSGIGGLKKRRETLISSPNPRAASQNTRFSNRKRSGYSSRPLSKGASLSIGLAESESPRDEDGVFQVAQPSRYLCVWKNRSTYKFLLFRPAAG